MSCAIEIEDESILDLSLYFLKTVIWVARVFCCILEQEKCLTISLPE